MPERPASEPDAVVELTIFPLDDDRAMPLDLARSWLGPDEAARAAAFRFEKHRDRYVRGRGMMRGLLARRLGAAPRDLIFSIGDKGKPHLGAGPLAFNLSHSEDTAAFALGEVPNLGVDLERFDRSVDIEGLARRCFRETEIAWMHSFPEAERHHAFFRIWTAKEARMKATGEGFSLEPRRIELAFDAAHPVRCLEPAAPTAHLATLALEEAACTVVALAPFRLAEAAPPVWDRED
jgi:4'-phosphopantetheinyl transferase